MSVYDDHDVIEAQRMSSDFLYRVFLSKNTTELDTFNKKIRERMLSTYTLSKRFQTLTERVVTDTHISTRNSKQAFLLFVGFYLNPDIVEDLIATAQVNPQRMKVFYEKHLPGLCEKLLDSSFSCLQEFVEKCRTVFFSL